MHRFGHRRSQLLNEVLSLNAQESGVADAVVKFDGFLNEVLSLNAQESWKRRETVTTTMNPQ